MNFFQKNHQKKMNPKQPPSTTTNELFNRRKLSVQLDTTLINNNENNFGHCEQLEIVDFVEDDFDDQHQDDGSTKSLNNGIRKLSTGVIGGGIGGGGGNQSKTKFGKTFRNIDIKTAKKLKQLLIGSSKSEISPKWCSQYFDFETKCPDLWYGLIQYEGGPCGVLAVVQAYLCAQIFHEEKEQLSLLDSAGYPQSNSKKEALLRKSLCEAIGDILWQIVSATNNHNKSNRNAIVAFEQAHAQLESTAEFSLDGITERIALVEFDEREELSEFLSKLLVENWHSLGCVSLVYSCIMTRGFDRIKLDNDFEGSKETLLTTECLLCTQELVNLMLTGRAVSNVFDRNLNCSDLILQGITRQSTIGFLSLYEYFQNFTVGSCYKNPKLPIYVVLSEGHFSVLFSKKPNNSIGKNKNRFDLYYYDGFLRLEQEICLTIDLQDQSPLDDVHQAKLNQTQTRSPTLLLDKNVQDVPIECVIRTKWPNASIDWNGAEKIF